MNLQDIVKIYDFTGKTFVITGGTGVLGSEIVRALAGCGANVALIARSPARVEEVFPHAKQYAGRLFPITGDVLEAESLTRAASAVQKEFGAIYGLINAAGGNHPAATTGPDQPFFQLPADALKFVQDLNLLGTVLPCQIFGKFLADQGSGVILNISSMSAFRPLTRVVGYSAAKAAINNFTCWLAVHMAREYSPQIRVNAIAPGFFLTEQNRYLLTNPESGELTPRGKIIIDHTPMGRFGQPEDLLGAVLWLLSPSAQFVTGVVLPVDGGFSAFSGV